MVCHYNYRKSDLNVLSLLALGIYSPSAFVILYTALDTCCCCFFLLHFLLLSCSIGGGPCHSIIISPQPTTRAEHAEGATKWEAAIGRDRASAKEKEATEPITAGDGAARVEIIFLHHVVQTGRLD
jgi:hypothetical protein